MNVFSRDMQNLTQASKRNFRDPAALDWPVELDPQAWQFTPELISIYQTPVWDSLSEFARRQLGFYEAINFFSLSIHGEKHLISEVSRQLYRDDDPDLNALLLHYIEEEARHMISFNEFCQRYAGKVYPDTSHPQDVTGNDALDTFLLFARIFLFEEIIDEYNRIIAADDRVAGIAGEINRFHHADEARHLAFERKFLHRQLDRLRPEWDQDTSRYVRDHLTGYLETIWKQFYNPQVYLDAGIENAAGILPEAFNHPAAVEHRRDLGMRRLSLLREMNLVEI